MSSISDGITQAPPKVIGLPAPTADEVLAARAAARAWSAGRCTEVRDLLEGTPESGTVILYCEKEHHMDIHAHRMVNPDGSTTTWRH